MSDATTQLKCETMKNETYTANEFKNGKWVNSFEVSGVEDLRDVIAVAKKYAGENTPDTWNMETKGGTVVEVIK